MTLEAPRPEDREPEASLDGLARALANLAAGEQGNQRGVDMEQKVAGLLRGVPGVRTVTETEKWSPEDRDMIDLEVCLDPDGDMAVDCVHVQIKASTKGVEHFKEQLKSRLKYKKQNHRPEDIKKWMLENRRILINGDLVVSKSHGHTRHVTDEEISASFIAQLQEINAYEKARRVS